MPQHSDEGRYEHGREGRIPRHARARTAAAEQASPPRRGFSHMAGRRRGNSSKVVRHLQDRLARVRRRHRVAVGRMVQRMLNLVEPPAADAADALALALTYFQETNRHSLTIPKRI